MERKVCGNVFLAKPEKKNMKIVEQSVVHELTRLKLIYLSSFTVDIRRKQLI